MIKENIKKNTKVKITPTQLEILEHRLTYPDGIAEALNDSGLTVSEDDVERAANRLLVMARAGVIDWAELDDLDKAVLWDSLDGSTFMALADSAVDDPSFVPGVTRLQYWNYSRSFESLADKLQAVGMDKVNCGYC